MRVPLCVLFVLVSTLASAQGFKKGTPIPLPSDMELVIVDDEVRGSTRLFKSGDVCKSSRNSDTAEYLKETMNSVTAVFKRGASTSRGDVCPHGATVTFTRAEFSQILREADEKFLREMFPDRK